MTQQDNNSAPNEPTSLDDDYLSDSVDDVERTFPDDNPEDAPAGGIDQLREAVRDDMPGDDQQAAEREANSPNEKHNQFDPHTFDTEENVDASFTAPDSESVADKEAADEVAGDPSAQDDHFERRIG